MLNKDVNVSVLGRQYSINNTAGNDAVKTEYKGQYYIKNGKHYVLYEEVSDDGSVTKCRLKFDDTTLEHNKSGELTTRFFFEKGTRHQTAYTTPFGDFLMGIDTKEFEFNESGAKINLHAVYDMEINDEFASENEIIIEITSI